MDKPSVGVDSLPEFTPDQLKAINEREKNILVSAAAGSGKTAVLVERILRIITDEKNPVDIGRLLVVTFTEAAASEMRERILKALNKQLAEEPDNKHIARQIMLIPRAYISTIHSFCNTVLKTHYNAAGIDPSFRIGDTVEISLIKEDIMESIFNKQYEERSPDFYRLLDIYGGKLYDKDLRELILRIYDFCEPQIDPNTWLSESAEMFNLGLADESGLSGSIWGQMILSQIKELIEGATASAKEAVKYCDMPGGPYKYRAALKSDILLLNEVYNICDSGSLESIKAALNNFTFEKLASIQKKDQVDPNLKEMVSNIRKKKIKDLIEGIRKKFFFKSFDLMAEDILEIYPVMGKLCELTTEFREKYIEEKLNGNILDFSDLEHYTYKILLENENIAAAYKDLFHEIYIDEYQDSNILQESILNLIARNNGRFMVGDVKQSIYKFRRANPDIFIQKYNSYEASGQNLRIDLNKNFRSRKNILTCVNFLFKQLMSTKIGSVNYGEAEMLHYGANYLEEAYDDTTELIIIETKDTDSEEENEEIKDLSAAEKEAAAIALRITGLTSQDEEKRAEYRDITILLRSLSYAQAFVKILSDAGIPVFANTGGGYFDNIEVLTILSLLRIIDNPRQDISLLAVLHSPIYGLSANDLVEIRLNCPKGDFYNALKLYLSSSCEKSIAAGEASQRFWEDLQRWRRLKSQLPVSKLISVIFDESGYYDYVALMPQAKIRKANLMALFEYAIQFEKTSLQGLFRFINYIEKLIERDSGLNDSPAENRENAVQIMTIHRSKGLEFPICFISNLGRKINRKDENASLILHQDKGLGPIHISLEPKIKSNTFTRAALSNLIHEENYAEELRILYVALTRAKEKLILTGCVNSYEKAFASWAESINYEGEKLPPHTVFGASTYLDFIGPCLVRHKEFENSEYLNSYNEKVYNDESRWKLSVVSSDAAFKAAEIHADATNEGPASDINFDYSIYNEYMKKIEESFNWEYDNIKATILPSKISISEIKRNYFSRMKHDSGEVQTDILEPAFNMPKFASGGILTAAQKGAAMHTLMEHLNINEVFTTEHIKALTESLKDRNLLSEQEAKSIDISKIYNFVTGELANRMRNASSISKELPFVMELDAKDAYLHNIDEGSLLVHGIIDCCFVENGRIILVDYKSDYVGTNGIEALKNRYKIQISIYKKALESSFGMEVSECLLYIFDKDICVNMLE